MLLWVRDLEDLTAQPLAGTENARYPFWSPDSSQVGFFDLTKLKKVEATGGPALSLCDAPNGKGGTWNRDGLIVFAPDSTAALSRVSEAGGEPNPATELDADVGDNSHRHPRFLPDGEHFLFVARTSFGGVQDKTRLMVGSLAGDEPREIMPTVSNVEFANGHLLYVFEQTLMARPFDPKTFELQGNGYPLAEGIYFDPGAFLGVFSASEAGLLAYQTGETQGARRDLKLEWRDRGGEVLDQVGDVDAYMEVVLAPDNQQAVIGLTDPETGNRDLWLLDLNRKLRTRFTFTDGNDWIPVWSPDGSQIAYTSEAEGTSDIYVQAVYGGGEPQLMHADNKLNFPISWSPDGRYLLFEAWSSGGPSIFALDLEEKGDPKTLISNQFFNRLPNVSPDGRWMAYSSNESGRSEIYVTAFPEPSRKWQISAEGGDAPRWSQDGSRIFFATDRALYVAQVDGSGDTFRIGEVGELFEIDFSGFDGYAYDVAADGDRFLVIRSSGEQIADEAFDPMTIVLNWQNDLRQ